MRRLVLVAHHTVTSLSEVVLFVSMESIGTLAFMTSWSSWLPQSTSTLTLVLPHLLPSILRGCSTQTSLPLSPPPKHFRKESLPPSPPSPPALRARPCCRDAFEPTYFELESNRTSKSRTQVRPNFKVWTSNRTEVFGKFQTYKKTFLGERNCIFFLTGWP